MKAHLNRRLDRLTDKLRPKGRWVCIKRLGRTDAEIDAEIQRLRGEGELTDSDLVIITGVPRSPDFGMNAQSNCK